MTGDGIALLELVEREGDGDLVRRVQAGGGSMEGDPATPVRIELYKGLPFRDWMGSCGHFQPGLVPEVVST